MSTFTFLTNHGAVFVFVAQNRAISSRRIALQLDLTERTVQRILADLQVAGYILKRKEGRTNRYELDFSLPMRRSGLHPVPVGELFAAMLKSGAEARSTRSGPKLLSRAVEKSKARGSIRERASAARGRTA